MGMETSRAHFARERHRGLRLIAEATRPGYVHPGNDLTVADYAAAQARFRGLAFTRPEARAAWLACGWGQWHDPAVLSRWLEQRPGTLVRAFPSWEEAEAWLVSA